jgi:hypothetical protein
MWPFSGPHFFLVLRVHIYPSCWFRLPSVSLSLPWIWLLILLATCLYNALHFHLEHGGSMLVQNDMVSYLTGLQSELFSFQLQTGKVVMTVPRNCMCWIAFGAWINIHAITFEWSPQEASCCSAVLFKSCHHGLRVSVYCTYFIYNNIYILALHIVMCISLWNFLQTSMLLAPIFSRTGLRLYRVIRSDCWGFNNLSYTIHLR